MSQNKTFEVKVREAAAHLFGIPVLCWQGREQKRVSDILFGAAFAKKEFEAETERLQAQIQFTSSKRAELEAQVAEKDDEIACLKSDLLIKSKEIGRSEHRGNTVDFIYDKVSLYKKQMETLRTENTRLAGLVELAREGLRVECADKHGIEMAGHMAKCSSCKAIKNITPRDEGGVGETFMSRNRL